MGQEFDKKRFLERLKKSKSRRSKKSFSLNPKLVSSFIKKCKESKEKPNEVIELFMEDFIIGDA